MGWLAFNTARKPFDDARVRQAIAYAIDKNFIAKALNGGFASVADGPIIATSPYASGRPEEVSAGPEARRAVAGRGRPEEGRQGERMTLTVDYMPGSDVQGKNVAEYLRSQLKKVGIVVQVRASPDFPTWAKRIASHDFDLTTDIVQLGRPGDRRAPDLSSATSATSSGPTPSRTGTLRSTRC